VLILPICTAGKDDICTNLTWRRRTVEERPPRPDPQHIQLLDVQDESDMTPTTAALCKEKPTGKNWANQHIFLSKIWPNYLPDLVPALLPSSEIAVPQALPCHPSSLALLQQLPIPPITVPSKLSTPTPQLILPSDAIIYNRSEWHHPNQLSR